MCRLLETEYWGVLHKGSTRKVISRLAFVLHKKGKYHNRVKLAICDLDHSTRVLALMIGWGHVIYLADSLSKSSGQLVGYPQGFGEGHQSRNRQGYGYFVETFFCLLFVCLIFS